MPLFFESIEKRLLLTINYECVGCEPSGEYVISINEEGSYDLCEFLKPITNGVVAQLTFFSLLNKFSPNGGKELVLISLLVGKISENLITQCVQNHKIHPNLLDGFMSMSAAETWLMAKNYFMTYGLLGVGTLTAFVLNKHLQAPDQNHNQGVKFPVGELIFLDGLLVIPFYMLFYCSINKNTTLNLVAE